MNKQLRSSRFESITHSVSLRSTTLNPLAQRTAILVLRKITSCASEKVNSLYNLNHSVLYFLRLGKRLPEGFGLSLILSITGSTAWNTLSPFFRYMNLSHHNEPQKKRKTYPLFFHVNDESPVMEYADAEEMNISGIDLLRRLWCMYISSCGDQCFKMISEEHLERKGGVKDPLELKGQNNTLSANTRNNPNSSSTAHWVTFFKWRTRLIAENRFL